MGNDGQPDAPDSGAPVPLDVIPLHSTNLLTVLDETGVVLYESPSIERILGFSQEDLVGGPVAEWFHPDDRERVLSAFQRVVSSEEHAVESVEYRHEQADGSYRWVESVASADPTPNGNYVVNTRDVSSRKAREEELEHSNARLDEFASAVSHDLKNPLNVARGRLQQAREECEDERLDEVARAHERMEALIDDLLELARAGTAIEDPDSVDLADLAEKCWRTVSSGDARLAVDVDRTVRADRSRLRRLLENLAGNAVSHGGEGVTVTIGELPDGSGFYVADDGAGIPEERREAVFERGRSTSEDGTGFGLSIVNGIADAHGWTVELTESSGGGARFEISGVEFE